ncbi:hypothetical protein CHUAL_000096 [Chamberlinius hualienensis]
MRINNSDDNLVCSESTYQLHHISSHFYQLQKYYAASVINVEAKYEEEINCCCCWIHFETFHLLFPGQSRFINCIYELISLRLSCHCHL